MGDWGRWLEIQLGNDGGLTEGEGILLEFLVGVEIDQFCHKRPDPQFVTTDLKSLVRKGLVTKVGRP